MVSLNRTVSAWFGENGVLLRSCDKYAELFGSVAVLQSWRNGAADPAEDQPIDVFLPAPGRSDLDRHWMPRVVQTGEGPQTSRYFRYIANKPTTEAPGVEFECEFLEITNEVLAATQARDLVHLLLNARDDVNTGDAANVDRWISPKNGLIGGDFYFARYNRHEQRRRRQFVLLFVGDSSGSANVGAMHGLAAGLILHNDWISDTEGFPTRAHRIINRLRKNADLDDEPIQENCAEMVIKHLSTELTKVKHTRPSNKSISPTAGVKLAPMTFGIEGSCLVLHPRSDSFWFCGGLPIWRVGANGVTEIGRRQHAHLGRDENIPYDRVAGKYERSDLFVACTDGVLDGLKGRDERRGASEFLHIVLSAFRELEAMDNVKPEARGSHLLRALINRLPVSLKERAPADDALILILTPPLSP